MPVGQGGEVVTRSARESVGGRSRGKSKSHYGKAFLQRLPNLGKNSSIIKWGRQRKEWDLEEN